MLHQECWMYDEPCTCTYRVLQCLNDPMNISMICIGVKRKKRDLETRPWLYQGQYGPSYISTLNKVRESILL